MTSNYASLLAVSILLLGSLGSSAALAQEDEGAAPAPQRRAQKKARPAKAPVNTSANNDEASTFNAGFQTGVNLGTATLANNAVLPAGLQGNSTTSTPSMHAGLMLGGNVEYGFSKQFFIQFEGSYVNKSVGISTTTANAQGVTQGTSTETDNLNYLEFALLAKMKFPGGKLVPNVFLGPNLGFLLSANQTFAAGSTGVVGSTTTTNTTTSNFSSTDFAVDSARASNIRCSKSPIFSFPCAIRWACPTFRRFPPPRAGKPVAFNFSLAWSSVSSERRTWTNAPPQAMIGLEKK